MRLVAFVVVISSVVSATSAVKCYQCANNEDNCNSGDCEGDWCVAMYVTKNPFANDQEKRVTKSCEKAHPNGFHNDSCVESISPSGRKLSCGCQKDYCNDDKAIQKLPVESHEDSGPVFPNATSPAPGTSKEQNVPLRPSSGGDLVNHTNIKCVCNEDQYCRNNECKGVACTAEVFDETGVTSGGGGIRLGVRITKGCATMIPDEAKDFQIVKPTTVSLPDGKTTKVTIFYCNDRDYCNSGVVHNHASLSLLILLISMSVVLITV